MAYNYSSSPSTSISINTRPFTRPPVSNPLPPPAPIIFPSSMFQSRDSRIRPGSSGFLAGSPYKSKINSTPIQFPDRPALSLSSLSTPLASTLPVSRPQPDTRSDSTDITVTFEDPDTTNIVIKSPPNNRTSAVIRNSTGEIAPIPLIHESSNFSHSTASRPPPRPVQQNSSNFSQSINNGNFYSSTSNGGNYSNYQSNGNSSVPAPAQISSAPPSTASLISLAIENDVELADRSSLIRELQRSLELAYESGSVEEAGQLAQRIASEKKQMKSRTMKIEQFLQRRELEAQIRSQLSKELENVRSALTERSLEMEAIKSKLRQFFFMNQTQQNQQFSSSSFGNSFNQKSNSSTSGVSLRDSILSKDSNNSPPLDILGFLPRAKKFIKEIQILLEQQCLIVDSMEVHENNGNNNNNNGNNNNVSDSNVDSPMEFNFSFSSLSSSSSFSLNPQEHRQFMELFQRDRMECIQKIQLQLNYLEELGRQIESLEKCVEFLCAPMPFVLPQNPSQSHYSNPTQTQSQTQSQTQNNGGFQSSTSKWNPASSAASRVLSPNKFSQSQFQSPNRHSNGNFATPANHQNQSQNQTNTTVHITARI